MCSTFRHKLAKVEARGVVFGIDDAVGVLYYMEFVIRDRGVNLQRGALLNTILCFDVTLRYTYGKVG